MQFLSKNNLKKLIYFSYLSVIGYQIYNHQMWRDELQAWLISKESQTIRDFIENIQFEGRSPLYHFLISPISHSTDNPEWLKLFTFIIVLGISYLLIFKLDISLLAKILILLGFPFLAGYTTISRDYIVIILLSLIILIRYLDGKHNFIDIFILSCLALLNVFGLIICLYWMVIKNRELKKNFFAHVPFLLFSVALSFFFIQPENQNTFQVRNNDNLLQLIIKTKNIIAEVFIFDSSRTFLTGAILLFTLVCFIFIFISDKKVFLGLTLGSILHLSVYLFTPGNFWWHKGMLSMIILFTLLIIFVKQLNNNLKLINKILLYIFLILQIYGNFGKDVKGVWLENYSNAKNASKFLTQYCENYCDYIVEQEYVGTPISAFLGGKKVYSFDKQRFSSFTIWDRKISDWDWDKAAELGSRMQNTLFLLNKKIDPPNNFKFLIGFEGAAWTDENYFIYELVE